MHGRNGRRAGTRREEVEYDHTVPPGFNKGNSLLFFLKMAYKLKLMKKDTFFLSHGYASGKLFDAF